MRASEKAQSGLLFISGSVHRRIPIFGYRMPSETFLQTLEAYRRKYEFLVHAYVVMPDHYHLLLWLPPQHRLVDLLRDFKSLVGKQIVAWMREEKLYRLLARFELGRNPRRARDARYCVLQYNNYVRGLEGSQALWQKINYIHSNPVYAGLATTPEDYPYSSARAYTGKELSWVRVDCLK